jgi:hypothetical protein
MIRFVNYLFYEASGTDTSDTKQHSGQCNKPRHAHRQLECDGVNEPRPSGKPRAGRVPDRRSHTNSELSKSIH